LGAEWSRACGHLAAEHPSTKVEWLLSKLVELAPPPRRRLNPSASPERSPGGRRRAISIVQLRTTLLRNGKLNSQDEDQEAGGGGQAGAQNGGAAQQPTNIIISKEVMGALGVMTSIDFSTGDGSGGCPVVASPPPPPPLLALGTFLPPAKTRALHDELSEDEEYVPSLFLCEDGSWSTEFPPILDQVERALDPSTQGVGEAEEEEDAEELEKERTLEWKLEVVRAALDAADDEEFEHPAVVREREKPS
jgi:hypothetical protein